VFAKGWGEKREGPVSHRKANEKARTKPKTSFFPDRRKDNSRQKGSEQPFFRVKPRKGKGPSGFPGSSKKKKVKVNIRGRPR